MNTFNFTILKWSLLQNYFPRRYLRTNEQWVMCMKKLCVWLIFNFFFLFYIRLQIRVIFFAQVQIIICHSEISKIFWTFLPHFSSIIECYLPKIECTKLYSSVSFPIKVRQIKCLRLTLFQTNWVYFPNASIFLTAYPLRTSLKYMIFRETVWWKGE